MSLIVAGTYDNSSKAEHAVNEMMASGIERSLVCCFAVNPPGQHAGFPIGGDHHASEGAKSAGGSAAAGAGIGGAVGLGVGLAVAPLTGPAGPVAGAAVGAYVGSLAGALKGMEDGGERPQAREHAPRRGGVLVAVCASQSAIEELALKVLRRTGAQDIEHALGVWRNGAWDNFDPTAPPQPIDETRGPGRAAA